MLTFFKIYIGEWLYLHLNQFKDINRQFGEGEGEGDGEGLK
jgi:hypothetical protein